MKRWLAAVVLLAGCESVPFIPIPIPLPGGEPSVTPGSDAYKRQVAERIAQVNRDAIADSLPEMLKSVVVLNVAIDGSGNLSHLSVRRSNGIRELENAALDSVRRAAPFSAPGKSLSFLETFLFRDDGRFQIRSLVN
jgi:TonB family protein